MKCGWTWGFGGQPCGEPAVIALESICRREHHFVTPTCAQHRAYGVPAGARCSPCLRAGEENKPDDRWVSLEAIS